MSFVEKAKNFDVAKMARTWWQGKPPAAKTAFLAALLAGYVSHLFVYTGRYFGMDDMGRIQDEIGPVGTGRWFNGWIISVLTQYYVLPMVSGILVSFFLAVAALYICTVLGINKKSNAVLAGILLSTFPSIANTNIYLTYTIDYHFAVLLAVLAVYITLKYKFGYLAGAVLAMLTLAIYQSKLNIAIALCLFYLSLQLLKGVSLKRIGGCAVRLALLIGLGGIFYAISLPISMRVFNTAFNDYKGMSPGSIQERLLSVTTIGRAIAHMYMSYFDGFFSNMFLNVFYIKHTYLVVFLLTALFVVLIVIKQELYKQWGRLLLLAAAFALVPFGSNFASLFDSGGVYGVMTYSYVLLLVFAIAVSEQCDNVYPLAKSLFMLALVLIIVNYVSGNNIYYLRAHYQNQRTFSLTVRVLDRIEPLLPLASENKVTVFGALPNEYLPGGTRFGASAENLREGSALFKGVFLNYDMESGPFALHQFGGNISNNHGIRLSMLAEGEERERLRQKVLDTDMPVWPAEGAVAVLDGVVVVNFGIADEAGGEGR
ncbi:MAG: glucosyltransferase domain-containing protein [Lachnospiraceae bacterium]|nr:glucosyltransferase domain-containing protein [Lachnospiraceae bacterium]